jgi:hypothetical protein
VVRKSPMILCRKIREDVIGLHSETILSIGPKVIRVQHRVAIQLCWDGFLEKRDD